MRAKLLPRISWQRSKHANQTPSPAHNPLRPPLRYAVLHGVLTPAECKYLIDVTEASGGYTPALVNTGAGEALIPDVRNSTRIMVDHGAFGALLFERVQPHVPREWTCEWTCRVACHGASDTLWSHSARLGLEQAS